jgi:ABC-2 type transport system ATP-binding protein
MRTDANPANFAILILEIGERIFGDVKRAGSGETVPRSSHRKAGLSSAWIRASGLRANYVSDGRSGATGNFDAGSLVIDCSAKTSALANLCPGTDNWNRQSETNRQRKKPSYMTTHLPTVSIDHITKSFGEFTAVSDLSLAVYPGRVYGLLGPNGAGKTTTIRMIVNITAPDSGQIKVFNQTVTPELQDRIGYLPEERGLYKKMKVGDQLKFFAALKNIDGKEAEQRVNHWLDRLKLAEWKNKKSSELSKGMQQKIQFIAAIIHEPGLLILDEPFSGLDPVNTEVLKEIILELKAAGKTIIFSTHQMEVAEKICDDICLINRSRKVLEGSIREVKRGFSRNAVALRLAGGDEVLEDRTIISKVQRHSDGLEVLLAEGASAQTLLQKLVAADATIERFELIEPSLHDIFIEKVTENV